jgi:hypothetical protein
MCAALSSGAMAPAIAELIDAFTDAFNRNDLDA